MKNPDLETLGKQVRSYRRNQDLEQKHLAATLDVSISTLSKIESGDYPGLKFEMLLRIARLMGMTGIDFEEMKFILVAQETGKKIS